MRRLYDTDDASDVLIYYSPDGYTAPVYPRRDQERPSHSAPFAGKHVPLLREMAAEGLPFTVREYADRFGVPKSGQQLYDTLALLVKAGELTRTVRKGIGVYQGVRG
jgi:hypothetical protein